jgi:hypothetical protein
MKYDKLDTVSVISGKYTSRTGQITGVSQVHRNNIPDMAEYEVAFKDLKIRETFKESDLVLVEKYDPAKEERERQETVKKAKEDADRLAEQKMEDALRKKIEKEFQIREELEAQYAAKKTPNSSQ